MAAETATARSDHLRGILVTGLASLLGIGAAGISSSLVGLAAGDRRALAPLAGAILIQFPVLKLMGIDVGDFGVKDYLYVVFMTFSMWFVTWTILLSSGVTLP